MSGAEGAEQNNENKYPKDNKNEEKSDDKHERIANQFQQGENAKRENTAGTDERGNAGSDNSQMKYFLVLSITSDSFKGLLQSSNSAWNFTACFHKTSMT